MATTVRLALEAMAAEGPLTASRIVEEATDPAHPLHDRFNWDDTDAAHQWRLQQARRLIVSVSIRPEGARRRIPLFIHVPADYGEGEYLSGAVIARQPEAWERARDQVLRALEATQESLAELEEVYRLYHREEPKLAAAGRDLKRTRQRVATVQAPA